MTDEQPVEPSGSDPDGGFFSRHPNVLIFTFVFGLLGALSLLQVCT